MKKQVKNAISLKKLTIARIQENVMNQIQGGDCLPTEPTWYEHSNNLSDVYCTTNDIP